MATPSAFLLCLVLASLCACAYSNSAQEHNDAQEPIARKIELYDGVFVKVPDNHNESRKLMSFEIDTNGNGETGRGLKKKKLMQRILPMFILPFVFQSTIIPLFLGMLKFMLMKSLIIGKLALVLIIINAFKNSNSYKG